MACLECSERSLCLVFALAVATCILAPSHAAEHVCNNIDIRNSVRSFRKLENCTVIEGFLQIVLIENSSPRDFENLSFPRLREITGYLFLYRAFGLHSLGRLFPNLAVIRGSTLFHNYALVVFEMFHLQEIGLGSLTHILRGSVRIEKNPTLCYIDSVDWDRLAPAGRGGHFIKDNKAREQCPDTCPPHCPLNPQCPLHSSVGDGRCRLCWGSATCQKVCSQECERHNKSCMPDAGNRCCNKECIGGCSGTTAADCVACRRVAFRDRCFESCPHNTYEYLGRRCLNELECKAIGGETSLPNQPNVYWKPFMHQCRPECPPHYTEQSNDKHGCIMCADRCPKVCPKTVVDSVASAQNLHGCTIINGSLEIQIQGGSNIIHELEQNLNSIQEIRGYLKVARSYPLVSLNFLKNLTKIHGDVLDRKEYSLLVLDNQNLQELWDENRRQKLEILNGKVFFHFNAKLCLSKIKALLNIDKWSSWDDRDISPSTNGDRVACDVTTIKIKILKTSSNMVGVQWDNFRNNIMDPRSLLGYVIYYREAPYNNISIYDGRDACGQDMWKVDDVEATDSQKPIKYLITHLKPYTQYAIYIRTFTIASAEKGAQSQIMYITTKPDTPTFPVNVRAYSTQQGEIVVQWKPPKLPNGNVTHYLVEGIQERDSQSIFLQRNYCHETSLTPNYKKSTVDVPQQASRNGSEPTRNGECCVCEKNKPKLAKEEEAAESQILFEDFVHNTIYIKNPHVEMRSSSSHGSNRKRAVPTRSPGIHLESSVSPLQLQGTTTTVTTAADNATENDVLDNSTFRFRHVVYQQLYLKLSNLKHFTKYTVAVRACQDENPDLKERCSIKAITSIRTLPMGGADDIESVTVRAENASLGSVTLRWEEPKNPNGMILAYHIEYKKVDSENFKPFVECVAQPLYRESRSYTLTKLLPGNYSLKIRATSLAGDGNWSTPHYFWITESHPGMSPIILAVIIVPVILVMVVMAGLGVWIYVKRKLDRSVPDGILYASVNPEYMSAGLVYEPDEWEVPREKIKLVRELGQGSFGMVYEGEGRDIDPDKELVQCAVKTVNESSSLRERIEFLQEASVMKAFNCHHVIKLLGVVSKGHPTLVIMELMARGDLKSYLRSHRPDEDNPAQSPPSLQQILQMAVEIADGMAYLAAKKFVHRDLAARNCMVAKDLTVKIGDFGMTRDIYETDYYRKGGKGLLPVRWMAPESLKDGVFTSQSDVWSYGVVLWEMATLASQPYQGLSNDQVLKYVINGGVMERPEFCPDSLCNLMKMCWERNPKARPTFTELIETLLSDVGPRFREVSFYFKQRPHMCLHEQEPEATPTTPLRGGSGDESDQINFFPSATLMPEDVDEEDDEIAAVRAVVPPSSSSEGSKGSKASNTSNGSLANGHVHFPHNSRTTVC